MGSIACRAPDTPLDEREEDMLYRTSPQTLHAYPIQMPRRDGTLGHSGVRPAVHHLFDWFLHRAGQTRLVSDSRKKLVPEDLGG